MIFLLGGPPKVGKSTISGRIRQKQAISVVSTDSLGAVLENVWSDETAPDLFVKAKFDKLPSAEREKLVTKGLGKHIDYIKKESHAVWKAVVAFSQRENEEGRDLLIEGVGVLPELVKQLDNVPYRVAFIGNQGEDHKQNIKRSAEENENDWMRNRSDEYISVFAMFVKRMSVYIEREAIKHGFEYLEMGRKPLGLVTEEVERLFGLYVR